MPTIPLYPPSTTHSSPSPLPQLLQTPSGLAILELQGTINFPAPPPPSTSSSTPQKSRVGRLTFPDYHISSGDSAANETGDDKWMKRVYLYIGQHQRLQGEVKKLAKPLAVIRRRCRPDDAPRGGEVDSDRGKVLGRKEEEKDELEIVEIVRWKLVFSNRPEPVGMDD